MLRIAVSLPVNRWKEGRLRLYEDDALLLDVPARGKADDTAAALNGNPSRDPTRPYGDTPAGGYQPVAVVVRRQVTPGIGAAWIPMQGASGDAWKALQNGRTGLGIHAGRGDGDLVATKGCIRLRDADFSALQGLMAGRRASLDVCDIPDTAAGVKAA